MIGLFICKRVFANYLRKFFLPPSKLFEKGVEPLQIEFDAHEAHKSSAQLEQLICDGRLDVGIHHSKESVDIYMVDTGVPEERKQSLGENQHTLTRRKSTREVCSI